MGIAFRYAISRLIKRGYLTLVYNTIFAQSLTRKYEAPLHAQPVIDSGLLAACKDVVKGFSYKEVGVPQGYLGCSVSRKTTTSTLSGPDLS